MIRVSIIVAFSRNFAIGLDNGLPWHLPEDLKNFKTLTMGKPIIMGRKTFESIGRALPGRTNIVVTRKRYWASCDVLVAHNFEQALSAAKADCLEDGKDELMIIGGEEIYRAAIPLATRMYITEIDIDVAGDAFFPKFDTNDWREIGRRRGESCIDHVYNFIIMERRL